MIFHRFQCADKPRTDKLDFVVRARIRTVAQFEIANYKRLQANCRCSGA